MAKRTPQSFTPQQLTDEAAIRMFILGGNATFTLKNTATQRRYTLKVKQLRDGGKATSPHFVKLMTGPDNETSYAYMGLVKNGAEYVHGGVKAKVPVDDRAHSTFEWLWRTINGKNKGGKTLADFPTFQFWHAGRCCKCNRKLTVPESIAAGIGPECAKH